MNGTDNDVAARCRELVDRVTEAASQTDNSELLSLVGDHEVGPGLVARVSVTENPDGSAKADILLPEGAQLDSGHGAVTPARAAVSEKPEDAEVVATDDNVNHPLRYSRGAVECIDAQESAMAGKPADEAHCVAEVIGYLWRYDMKEPVRSLESAAWYLDRLISKAKQRYQSAEGR